MAKCTLLVDADDTLWENNRYFEKTIAECIALLEPLGYSPEYVRRILNETERRNIQQHGYGVRSFGRSLEETCLALAGELAGPHLRERIAALLGELESVTPVILEGVPETLAYLAARHRLILVTKGEPAEQAAKLQKSGLQAFFHAVEIVPEKDVSEYHRIVKQHRIVKSRAWMIGNSPRSDINPALAAGLNAVFIPHPATWELEHAEIRSGAGKLLVVPSFRSLRYHF